MPSLDSNAQEWIESSNQWALGLGPNWRGIKALGQGGFGITGSLEYVGGQEGVNAFSPHTKLVVKQTRGFNGEEGGAVYEARRLWNFKDKCKHITQIVAGPFVEQGSNILADVESGIDTGEVERFYMEYLPGGDLDDYENNRGIEDNGEFKKWSEKELWRMFLCLAKAALAMKSGTEDPSEAPWDYDLCHFDIKGANILVGDEHTLGANNGDHREFPIMKMVDFGLADWLPAPGEDPNWERHRRGVGTMWYCPPEGRMVPKRWVTPPDREGMVVPFNPEDLSRDASNIFQIGFMMYVYIVGDIKAGLVTYPRFCPWSERLRRGWNFGTRMAELGSAYSMTLRGLIMECLMAEPRHRIPPAELVRVIQRVLTDMENEVFVDLAVPVDLREVHSDVERNTSYGEQLTRAHQVEADNLRVAMENELRLELRERRERERREQREREEQERREEERRLQEQWQAEYEANEQAWFQARQATPDHLKVRKMRRRQRAAKRIKKGVSTALGLFKFNRTPSGNLLPENAPEDEAPEGEQPGSNQSVVQLPEPQLPEPQRAPSGAEVVDKLTKIVGANTDHSTLLLSLRNYIESWRRTNELPPYSRHRGIPRQLYELFRRYPAGESLDFLSPILLAIRFALDQSAARGDDLAPDLKAIVEENFDNEGVQAALERFGNDWLNSAHGPGPAAFFPELSKEVYNRLVAGGQGISGVALQQQLMYLDDWVSRAVRQLHHDPPTPASTPDLEPNLRSLVDSNASNLKVLRFMYREVDRWFRRGAREDALPFQEAVPDPVISLALQRALGGNIRRLIGHELRRHMQRLLFALDSAVARKEGKHGDIVVMYRDPPLPDHVLDQIARLPNLHPGREELKKLYRERRRAPNIYALLIEGVDRLLDASVYELAEDLQDLRVGRVRGGLGGRNPRGPVMPSRAHSRHPSRSLAGRPPADIPIGVALPGPDHPAPDHPGPDHPDDRSYDSNGFLRERDADGGADGPDQPGPDQPDAESYDSDGFLRERGADGGADEQAPPPHPQHAPPPVPAPQHAPPLPPIPENAPPPPPGANFPANDSLELHRPPAPPPPAAVPGSGSLDINQFPPVPIVVDEPEDPGRAALDIARAGWGSGASMDLRVPPQGDGPDGTGGRNVTPHGQPPGPAQRNNPAAGVAGHIHTPLGQPPGPAQQRRGGIGGFFQNLRPNRGNRPNRGGWTIPGTRRPGGVARSSTQPRARGPRAPGGLQRAVHGALQGAAGLNLGFMG